jgi:hypothetical protein
MTSDDTIIPSASDGEFSEAEWRELTRILRRAEPLFVRLAEDLGLRVLSSARWPELRLKKQEGWTITEIRLSLSPGARSRGSQTRWLVNLVRYPRFAWLPIGGASAELMAEIAEDEVNAGPPVSDCLRSAVRHMAPGTTPDRS